MPEGRLQAVLLARAVLSRRSCDKSANIWDHPLSDTGRAPPRPGRSLVPSLQEAVSRWEPRVLFHLSRAGAEPLSPGSGQGRSRLGRNWNRRSPAIPRRCCALKTRPPHGSPGPLEAAGVLGAAGQPGDAGREDPGRGYPSRAAGEGAGRAGVYSRSAVPARPSSAIVPPRIGIRVWSPGGGASQSLPRFSSLAWKVQVMGSPHGRAVGGMKRLLK